MFVNNTRNLSSIVLMSEQFYFVFSFSFALHFIPMYIYSYILVIVCKSWRSVRDVLINEYYYDETVELGICDQAPDDSDHEQPR